MFRGQLHVLRVCDANNDELTLSQFREGVFFLKAAAFLLGNGLLQAESTASV